MEYPTQTVPANHAPHTIKQAEECVALRSAIAGVEYRYNQVDPYAKRKLAKLIYEVLPSGAGWMKGRVDDAVEIHYRRHNRVRDWNPYQYTLFLRFQNYNSNGFADGVTSIRVMIRVEDKPHGGPRWGCSGGFSWRVMLSGGRKEYMTRDRDFFEETIAWELEQLSDKLRADNFNLPEEV